MCFLKKSRKAVRTFDKDLNFMEVWSGGDGMLFWWGRYTKTDEMIFKYSKYVVCVSFIHNECVQPV